MSEKLANERAKSWRRQHTITDWEFAEIGVLLCDHQPRDLALMVVRLQGELEVQKMLSQTVQNIPHDK